MARYCNLDELIETFEERNRNTCNGSLICLQLLRMLKTVPTSDVAPRSEFDEIPLDVHEALKQRAIEKAKSKVTREIFWEIDKLLTRIITDDESGDTFIGVDMQKYYGLKKKYVEEEHEQ